MLITGDKILTKKLILGGDPQQLKSAGYHLKIHSIISNNQGSKGNSVLEPVTAYNLRPSEMAIIVSQETFAIPKGAGITALVTLASSMTKQGLLALDHGIVDPSYEGPIGTLIINFSNTNVMLREGDEFFRVLFLTHEPIKDSVDYPCQKFTHDEYIKVQQNILLTKFSSSFLNTNELIAKVSNEIVTDRWPQLESSLVAKIAKTVFWKYSWMIFAMLLFVPHLLPLMWKFISPLLPDNVIEIISKIETFLATL
ncbi:hypothetical protein N9850_09270 [Granulosicoccus sp.]|nr:hypothetical protein [Granulosicoccus sp.]MDB4223948.1 hypothetical protein [Granulosicoccus sp.]